MQSRKGIAKPQNILATFVFSLGAFARPDNP